MKIVTVMPFKRGVIKEEFTYFSAKNIENGDIVNIPMRNKKNLGLVISSEDVSKEKSNIKDMPYNLKKIDEVKEKSIFQKDFIDSIFLVSKYFAIKKNLAVSSLIPSVMIEEYDKILKIKKNEEIKNTDEINSKNIKEEKLLFQASLEDRINFYKTLIRSSFAEKKSLFMILPTEKDIENFYDSLSKGIENFTFLLHGGLSKKKQLGNIEKILNSDHPILVLGTAPYLSISRDDFKTIILEHESSGAYKTIKKPSTDLRIYAEVFAFKTEAKFILADSFLRFETIARKEIDNFGEVHPMSFRTNFNGEVKIVGKNEPIKKLNEGEAENVKFKILTDSTITEIRKSIQKNENVFVFALRKGLATMTICRDCALTVECEKCSAPVVLYQTKNNNKRIFICNKCNTEKNPATICSGCGGWNLMPLGIGTDTVFEELKRIFPETNILKLDRDSTKTAKEAEATVEEFKKPGSILVGTEMALFYLKEKTSLSVISAFDSLWSIPNFRMSEKIIQIITSILSKTENELIIETKNEQDEIINAVKIDNLTSFVREEIRDRKNLGYPPFKRFIKISFLGNKIETAEARKFLSENFKEYNPEIFSGFIAKFKDRFITNVLIKIDPQNWSLPELSHNAKIDETLSEKILSLPSEFLISIDPEDLA